MIKFFKQKNKGFTLVETLVAISIFTMSILGLLSTLSRGVTDTSYAKQKMVASYLAEEGIEYLRNQRDNYVLYNETTGLTWAQFKAAFANPSYPTTSDYSNYTRTLTMSLVNTDEVKISSTVSWNQGSGPHSITLLENLYNWVE